MGKKIRLKDETKELLYGVGLLLLGALAFVWVANKQHDVESSADKNGFIIHSSFGRTDGLHLGDSVRIAGINVGKVIRADLLDDYHVDLTFLLDKDYKIPEDSSASIESDSLLGGKYVDITLGAEDATIPYDGHLIYTQDAMVLDELIDMVIAYAKSKQEQEAKKCDCDKKEKK